MMFETIVENVVSELSNQLSSELNERRFRIFVSGRLEEIHTAFMHQFETESYFDDLDSYMEIKAFWDNLLRSFLKVGKRESMEQYVRGFCADFLTEYKKYAVCSQQLEQELLKLSIQLKKAMADCKYLDNDSKMIYFIFDRLDETGEKLDRLQETESGTREEVRQIHQLLMTYTKEKSEPEEGKNRKNRKQDIRYKELVSIRNDSNMSYMEKEWLYLEWAKKTGDMKEALVWMADNCRLAGESERACFLFNRVADKYEEEYRLYNNAGCLLNELGRPTEALEAFQKVLSVDENDIDGLYNISTTLYDLEEQTQSYQYIQKAYRLEGEDADIANFYGMHLMLRGNDDLAKAGQIMEAALEKHPKDFFFTAESGDSFHDSEKIRYCYFDVSRIVRGKSKACACGRKLGAGLWYERC